MPEWKPRAEGGPRGPKGKAPPKDGETPAASSESSSDGKGRGRQRKSRR
jgi:hypothetical protein